MGNWEIHGIIGIRKQTDQGTPAARTPYIWGGYGGSALRSAESEFPGFPGILRRLVDRPGADPHHTPTLDRPDFLPPLRL